MRVESWRTAEPAVPLAPETGAALTHKGREAAEAAGLSAGPAADSERAQPSLREAVDNLNAAARLLKTFLRFYIDQEDHHIVVHVVDEETGTVIRSIPPEQLLEVYNSMQSLVGILLDVRI